MNNYVYQDLGVGGWTDTVKKIGKGAFDVIQTHGAAKGRAAAFEELAKAKADAAMPVGGMPKWLLPVGIGAAALVLVLILKKR